MKTLIIHPKDSSTSFLDIVYKPIQDKTVITGGISKSKIKELIREHDRVMMMGHGSPGGLFAVGQFKETNGYIIDASLVGELEKKTDNVYIWCHANAFVDKHNLKGFYSGMFISEVGEAYVCGLPGTTQESVDESNYGFCNILAECINNDKKMIYDNVMKKYGLIAENNSVATYNYKRLYVS